MTAPLQDAYDRLFERYGPQRWWPGDSPLEILVGTVLVQNTNWRNVEKAIDNVAEVAHVQWFGQAGGKTAVPVVIDVAAHAVGGDGDHRYRRG